MDVLRPEFTKHLAARLSEGACIKLVGPHGQGRRRTLTDLRPCLPDALTVLQANLRTYPNKLTSLLGDLCAQAGLATVERLSALLDALQQGPGRTLIVLHNLDELEAGKTSGYDGAFFAVLNGICDRAGLSLLCVLEHEHGPWPLHLEALGLPALTEDEIMAELARRHSPATPSAWPAIARWIAAQPAPYTLLDRPEAWPSQA